MKCPHCKVPMAVLELDNVEVDNCFSCGGIWLDSGELEVLLKDSPHKNDIIEQISTAVRVKEKKIRCPICGKRMKKGLVFNEIVIDFCKKGHGYWLDGGELDKILLKAELHNENKVVRYLKRIFKNKV